MNCYQYFSKRKAVNSSRTFHICLFSVCSDLKVHFSLIQTEHLSQGQIYYFRHDLHCLLSPIFPVISISMPSYKKGNMACKSSCTSDLPWDTEPGSAPCQGRQSCHVQMANPCVAILRCCREHYLWAAVRKKYKKTKTDTKRLPKSLLKATVFHRSFLPWFPSFGSPHASPVLRQRKHLWRLPSKSGRYPDLPLL